MIFPKYIQKGDTIGVTATSNGITDEIKIKRFNDGKANLEKVGYDVLFTDNVFTADHRGCSSDGRTRAKQLHNLISNEDVSAIVLAAGGDYLMEMLEHLDFEEIKNNPKWIQGYSDSTGLLYAITTLCDVATVYGFHFSDFGMAPWQDCVKTGFGILEGKEKVQKSFEYYESDRHDYVTGKEGYFNDERVCWKNARGEEKIEIKGRLLGGCLDVINFITGTPYDGTLKYIEKYSEDGILWFLESFNLEDVVMITNLWRLKQMGYFKNAKGFVFGRPLMYNTWIDQSYEDAVMSVLGDLNVPIIFDADIGHKGPQFSMINGAVAKVTSEGGKGVLEYA